MKNSFYISLALVAALLLGTQTGRAQIGVNAIFDSIAFTDVTDTVTVNDTFYMFNPVKEDGYYFDAQYGTWAGWDTAKGTYTANFSIPFGTGTPQSPIRLFGKTLQRYHADDTMAVYGVAVTMGTSGVHLSFFGQAPVLLCKMRRQTRFIL